VGLGFFLLLKVWQSVAPENFWHSSTVKVNLVLAFIYTLAGAAAAFGGAYLYHTEQMNCRTVNNLIPNMALADVIANLFVRMPFLLMILSHLSIEVTTNGQMERFNKGFTDNEKTLGLVVTVMGGAQLVCALILYAMSLIPLLIANAVVVSVQDSIVYSTGSNCLFLYRYLEFEAVYPIVGLGFFIFSFAYSKCHNGPTGDGWFKALLAIATIYLVAGTIVLLYAISLVTSNGSDCRMMSNSVVSMAIIDIVANGIFRIPGFLIAAWALNVYGGPEVYAKVSVPLVPV